MNLNNNRKVAGVIRIFGILETTEMNEEGSETKNVNNITEVAIRTLVMKIAKSGDLPFYC